MNFSCEIHLVLYCLCFVESSIIGLLSTEYMVEYVYDVLIILHQSIIKFVLPDSVPDFHVDLPDRSPVERKMTRHW